MKNYNITILGCGISGMITALRLARQQFSVQIIEQRAINDPNFFQDPRSTALTASSQKFFTKLGIWSKIAQLAGNINDIYVVDNKSPRMLHFGAFALEKGEIMGYLVQNVKFKKLLFDLVTTNPYISIQDQTSYLLEKNTPQGCSFLLNGKLRHQCDLAIICDGKNSVLKKDFFSKQIDKSYRQYALTFDVKHQLPHEGTAIEHFLPTGPFAILPLKEPYHSSIVWTMDPILKKLITELDKNDFKQLVEANFGPFLGKIQLEEKMNFFPLSAYLTKNYFNKSLLLIADTAHIIHPLAGQGLNQGIKDIDCLANLLAEYGLSNYSLSEYERLRKTDNLHMFEITDQLNRVFSSHNPYLRLARKAGFLAIEKIPLLKKYLIKYAMGQRI